MTRGLAIAIAVANVASVVVHAPLVAGMGT